MRCVRLTERLALTDFPRVRFLTSLRASFSSTVQLRDRLSELADVAFDEFGIFSADSWKALRSYLVSDENSLRESCSKRGGTSAATTTVAVAVAVTVTVTATAT